MKLKKIYPMTPYLNVDWQLSNKCNYKCTYCNFDSNGGNFDWHNIDKCKILIDKIMKRSAALKRHEFVHFNLLGGEVTMWKDFIELCSYIKKYENTYITIMTNGYKRKNWWEKNKKYFDSVTISYHNQFAKTKNIIEIANIIGDDCQLEIQVLMDYKNFDKCVHAFYSFLDNIDCGRITIKKGEVELGLGKWMPYTKQQLSWLEHGLELSDRYYRLFQSKTFLKLDMFKRKHYRSNFVEDDEGNIFKITNKEIIIKNLNKFKGWECYMGIDSIAIKSDGNIRPSSACNFQLKFSNINKDNFDNFKWYDTPVICNYDGCYCGADISIPKNVK